ncbi:uncharacterized protein LOC143210771, partial [Lasioglossum baleicum]|uniref:uncharacterized protein LOC143210771 n=1 Tax=Lasioglossum baleicum TaxID=434251 RepID=UPI003FCCE9CF
NYALTADSSIVPGECSLDGTNISSLRRRKVLSDTLAKPVGGIVSGSSPESNIVISSSSSVSNLYRSSHVDETKSTIPSKKMITYPKIMTSYPKILTSNKSSPRDVRKIKKIDGRYVKPPSSEPPVFLKCNVRKKSDHDNDTIPCEPEPLANEDSCKSPATITDLDVQFTKVSLGTISKLDSRLGRGMPGPSPSPDSQTLTQYCNFEDKKVMRVAPHIRRKDVIYDTVDAWSYANSSQNSSELCRYKPFISGGTYPIDLPVRPARSDLNSAKLNDLPARKSFMKTYDIDVPTNCE